MLRIELELRQHAGRCNGKLIVTKEQFVEFGLHPRMVAPALRELEALGIIRIEHGRGGNAEHRQPNRFLLNYLCGAVDADEQITNAWRLFKPWTKLWKSVALPARLRTRKRLLTAAERLANEIIFGVTKCTRNCSAPLELDSFMRRF